MADQTITPEIEEILQSCSFEKEGTLLKIPGQLDPTTYGKVDLLLKMLGGKWNKSKGGHVFPRDTRGTFKTCLDSKMVPDLKKRRQAFYTPDEVVKQVIDHCWLPDKLVLEPSAGSGAIALAARAAGAEVHCIELDPFESETLKQHGFKTRTGDFLEMEPEAIYDYVIMNPPFNKNQDSAHVLHALKWIKPYGKLCAIVSPSFKIEVLRGLAKKYGMDQVEFDTIEAGAFKESGTNIETRILTVRVGNLKEVNPVTRDNQQIEWRAHQLAVETIHGEGGKELQLNSEHTAEKRMRERIRNATRKAAEFSYRQDKNQLNNLIVDDELLEKIILVAIQEVDSYFDLPPIQTGENKTPPVEAIVTPTKLNPADNSTQKIEKVVLTNQPVKLQQFELSLD